MRPDPVQKRSEEIELFGKRAFVVGQFMAEERKGFRERPAPEDDFGPARGDRIQRGEALEDADRIIGGEDGDGDPSRMRVVLAAMAASTTSGAETAKSSR